MSQPSSPRRELVRTLPFAIVALSFGSATILSSWGCRRSASHADAPPALIVGRLDAELRAVDSEGEPKALEASVDEMARRALAKADTLRLVDDPGQLGEDVGRLRVTAFVGPDGATGKLHAIVGVKLAHAGPLPLEWEVDSVLDSPRQGSSLDDAAYASHLEETVGAAVRALNEQAEVSLRRPEGVVEALAAKSAPARVAAARIVGHLRTKEAVAPLCRELERADEVVAPALARALAAIGDPRGVPCIQQWGEGEVARMPVVIRALAAMPDESARSALEEIAASHPRGSLRRLAITEIAAQDRRGEPLGAEDAHDHDDEEELPAALKTLVAALSDEDQRVRLGAAKALADTSSPHAVRPLCEMLSRDEPDEMLAALGSLAELGEAAAIPCLMRWAAEDGRRLALTIPAFATIGGPEAAGVLELLVRESSSSEIRRLAESALAQVRREEQAKAPGRSPGPPLPGRGGD